MKPLMPSPSKPRTTLPTPTNLNSLLTIIWTFFLIAPNLTSALAFLPVCASSCYLTAFDSEYSECDALNYSSCLCTIVTSTDYLTCIEDDCQTADLQAAAEYGEQYCGAGYSTFVGGAAQTATATAVTSIATAINNPVEATTTTAFAEATSTSSAAAAAAPSPTSSTTTVIIQQDSSSSGGLSTGAKAGIGAGAGVGGVAVLCLVGVLAWKLGQRRTKKEEERRVAAARAAAAAGGAGNNGNNNGNSNGGGGGGMVSGGVNYVPSGSGEEEATWTKIEATATETELGTGQGHEGGGEFTSCAGYYVVNEGNV